MSFFRSIIGRSEVAIREAQMVTRRTFQKTDYDRPMHVRLARDNWTFAAALGCVALVTGISAFQCYEFVIRK